MLAPSESSAREALSLLRNLCFYAAILGCLDVPRTFAGDLGPLSESQQKFVNELAVKSRSAESERAAVIAGVDGWFFLSSDIRFLSVGQFWGADAAKVSRAHKPDSADPIPAIVDFHEQLKKRGIDLLLMPVPPKAAIYPEKILPKPCQRAQPGFLQDRYALVWTGLCSRGTNDQGENSRETRRAAAERLRSRMERDHDQRRSWRSCRG